MKHFSKNSLAILCGAALWGAPAVNAEEINLTINGMVCAFCAQGLSDLARSFDPVQDAVVDMDNRLVVLIVKPGHDMTDELVHEYVRDAGYDLESFFRVDQSTSANIQKLQELLGTNLPSRPSSAYIWTDTVDGEATYTFARLSINRNHLRRWNRALNRSDTDSHALPDSAPAWWNEGIDTAGMTHFTMRGHSGSKLPGGTVVFMRIAN